MQLSLMNGRFLMAMKKLNWIFDGENVVSLLLVHLVNDGGQSRRLTRTSWARDQYNSVTYIHDFFQYFRKAQLLEARDFVRDDTHNDGAAPALLEDIDAETRHPRDSIRKIGGAVSLELADGSLIFPHDVVGNRHGVLRT